MELSREELNRLNSESVDPKPFGSITRPYDNVDMKDEDLAEKISARNRAGKPTFLLRMEYDRRLRQRGL